MSRNQVAVRWSRRTLLRGAGLLAALGTVGWTTAASPLVRWSQPAPVRLLLPGSTLDPTLSQSLLDGMRLYSERFDPLPGGRRLEIMVEPVGTSPFQLQRHLAETTPTRPTRLLVGLTHAASAAFLGPQLATSDSVLLAASTGEQIVTPDRSSQQIFHHTLGLWQSSWALGAWCAAKLGRTAVIVSDLVEAGYDLVGAFWHGFTSAGGSIVNLHVLPGVRDATGLAPVLQAVTEREPSVVFVACSGPAASIFLHAYQRLPIAQRPPLVGSSFVLPANAVASAELTLPLLTVQPWTDAVAGELAKRFRTIHLQERGHPPTQLTLLGFELAQLLSAALRTTGGDVEDGSALRAALGQAAVVSPRGVIAMQSGTRATLGPRWLTDTDWSGGTVRSQLVEPVPTIAEHDHRLAAFQTELRSGWLNPYLFP